MVKDTINRINIGLRIEDISRISNGFWKDDKDKVRIFLQLLSKANKLYTCDNYYITRIIELTLYRFNRISISNYRQLIHNMLMEMV